MLFFFSVYSTFFFFFNDTATTEIYTLSLHDALPISLARSAKCWTAPALGLDRLHVAQPRKADATVGPPPAGSEREPRIAPPAQRELPGGAMCFRGGLSGQVHTQRKVVTDE